MKVTGYSQTLHIVFEFFCVTVTHDIKMCYSSQYMFISSSLNIYIYIYMCVCVCVWPKTTKTAPVQLLASNPTNHSSKTKRT